MPARSRTAACLRPHVRGEDEQPIASVVAGQFGPATVQLLHDDGGVLVTEVALHLDEVADRLARGSPGDNAVEALQRLGRRADLGLRHPLVESRPVEKVNTRPPGAPSLAF